MTLVISLRSRYIPFIIWAPLWMRSIRTWLKGIFFQRHRRKSEGVRLFQRVSAIPAIPRGHIYSKWNVPSTTRPFWQLSQKLDREFFSVPLGHVRVISWVAFVNGSNLIIRFRKMKVSSLSRKDMMASIEVSEREEAGVNQGGFWEVQSNPLNLNS